MKLNDFIVQTGGQAALELHVDCSTKHLLSKQLAPYLLESSDIVTDKAAEQCMIIMSQASFADSEQECVDVATGMMMVMRKVDIFPMISLHKGLDLASRCLVGLSLFRKAMEARTNRFGTPSLSFYRDVGINAYKQEGMINVSYHFRQWEGFISEMFAG